MNQVVAKRDEAQVVEQGQGSAVLSMIERAARDPQVDIEKMRQLLQMRADEESRMAKRFFTAAFVAMKPKLPVIDRKGRIEIRKKDASGERTGPIQQSTGYARWEDIDEAITPILSEHGFVLSFRSSAAADGKLIVTAVLDHEAGHSESTDTPPLMHDSSGSKNAVQAVGSSLSYGKRIAATLLLNIRTKGEDDDGAAADASATITDEQLQFLIAACDEVGADKAAFCKYLKIDGLALLPASRYAEAMNLLDQKRKKAGK